VSKGCNHALTLGTAHVAQSDDVSVLGVQLSSNLSLDKHVNVVHAKCFFQLRQLRRIRLSFDDDSVATFVHAFITSRVDYCSSLLIGARRRRPTSCNVSSTRQHESSRTHASSTGDSLISGEVSYTGWTLSTGFGSESASRCSDVCTRWLLDTCRPAANANPSPAFLVVATCDRLTVVISTSPM